MRCKNPIALIFSGVITLFFAISLAIAPTAPAFSSSLEGMPVDHLPSDISSEQVCQPLDRGFLAQLDLEQGVPITGLTSEQYLVVGDVYREKGDVEKATEAYRRSVLQEVETRSLNIDIIAGARSRIAVMQPKEEAAKRLKAIKDSYVTLTSWPNPSAWPWQPPGYRCDCLQSPLIGYVCHIIC